MAKFITVSSDRAESGIYEFIKRVSTDKCEEYTINIFASTRYILYINGKYLCEGPCRGKRDIRYYDTVKTKLNKGINVVRAVVMHITEEERFSSVFKQSKPILIFNASSENGEILTDTTWECFYRTGHRLFRAEGYFDSLAPCEEIFADSKTVPMHVAEWGYYGNDFSGTECIPWGCIGGVGNLKPRPIPMIYPGKEIKFKVVKSGEDYVELDAGEYVCARVSANIAANADVKIIYSECYTFSEEPKKRKRDDSRGELKGTYDIIHTKDDDYTFSTYWFKAFRYIRIETKNPEENISNICAWRINYPLDIESEFNCSDEYYNKMYEISINTMLCCMHEIFVDCPHYEQQQYQMDTAIEANVSMRMSRDTRLIRKCIDDLAGSQISDGLLCANYPNAGIQIIPGFSFFWIFMLKDYLEFSKDTDFIYNYIGVMDKILNYFDVQTKEQGYISRSIFWDYVDCVPEWEEGVPDVQNGDMLTIYNLYYLCALKDAAWICRKIGKKNYENEYSERYEKLKQIVDKLSFDGELYTDGSKNRHHSMHTVIWAALSGMAEGDKLKKMMTHLFDEDISRSSFSMRYYLFRAIEKSGMYNELVPKLLDDWRKMVDLNCTTWCETYPEITRSECHAWCSAPLYEFIACVLGVRCNFDDEITIMPRTMGLTFAHGRVPTRYGSVDVSWKIENNKFKVTVTAPKNAKKQLVLPNGEKIYSESEMINAEVDIL